MSAFYDAFFSPVWKKMFSDSLPSSFSLISFFHKMQIHPSFIHKKCLLIACKSDPIAPHFPWPRALLKQQYSSIENLYTKSIFKKKK